MCILYFQESGRQSEEDTTIDLESVNQHAAAGMGWQGRIFQATQKELCKIAAVRTIDN